MDVANLIFLFSVRFVLITNFFVLTDNCWSSEPDYFDGLQVLSSSIDDADQKGFYVLEDFSFKPFSDELPSEYKVYAYESYFKGVQPDIGVRIGRDTVQNGLIDSLKTQIRQFDT